MSGTESPDKRHSSRTASVKPSASSCTSKYSPQVTSTANVTRRSPSGGSSTAESEMRDRILERELRTRAN